jgi:hypothetical protein
MSLENNIYTYKRTHDIASSAARQKQREHHIEREEKNAARFCAVLIMV